MIEFVGPRMPLDIPLFLYIPQEERKAAWKDRPNLPPVRTTEFTETCKDWDEWVKQKRAMIPETKKAKNARGLERMKEKHAGQKWVRVEEPVEPVEAENALE